MRCPKCGFVSFNHLDNCKKCGRDLTEQKAMLGIRSVKRQPASAPPEVEPPEAETPSAMATEGEGAPVSAGTGEAEEESFSLDEISFGEPENGVPDEILGDIGVGAGEETTGLDLGELPSGEAAEGIEMPSFDDNLDDLSFEAEFEPSFDNAVEEGPVVGTGFPEGEAGPETGFSEVPKEGETVSPEEGQEGEVNFEDAFAGNFVQEEEGVALGAEREAAVPQMSLALEEVEEEAPPRVQVIPDIGEVKKAGFIRRALAFVLDNVIQGIILYAFVFAGVYALSRGVSMSGGGLSVEHVVNLIVPIVLLSYLVNAGYCTFFHWATGQTPGKMLFKIRVVGTDGGSLSLGKAFFRWIGYYISAIPLMLGYFMPLIDRQHQALHDKIAKTYVIDLRALPQEEVESEEEVEENASPEVEEEGLGSDF